MLKEHNLDLYNLSYGFSIKDTNNFGNSIWSSLINIAITSHGNRLTLHDFEQWQITVYFNRW